jgi:superfamily II DNA/RNA helicase
VHRVGRTGRAGRSGVGITLVDHEQALEVSRIARSLELDREFSASGLAAGPPPPSARQQERRGEGRGPHRSRRRSGTR